MEQFPAIIKFLDDVLSCILPEDIIRFSLYGNIVSFNKNDIKKELMLLKHLMNELTVSVSPDKNIADLDVVIMEKGDYDTLMQAGKITAELLDTLAKHIFGGK